jgi:hypothetical protein
MEKIILPALVLNDYANTPYATWMEQGIKTIETRWFTFKHRGDLVICCGNKSNTPNAGLAVAVVDLFGAEQMREQHEKAACIHAEPGRIAHHTRNLRHFSRKFRFAPQKIRGSFQSIFWIELPADVQLVTPQLCK